jgi:hypothetical protein
MGPRELPVSDLDTSARLRRRERSMDDLGGAEHWRGIWACRTERSRCRGRRRDRPCDRGIGRRGPPKWPFGVNGSRDRPRSPRRRSRVGCPRWAFAPVRSAGRQADGGVGGPLSGEGGSYGSWSWSSTPMARDGAMRARRGMGGSRTRVDAHPCLGGSHAGPPIPLRQRRDWMPRWRQCGPYAESGPQGGRSPAPRAPPGIGERGADRHPCTGT